MRHCQLVGLNVRWEFAFDGIAGHQREYITWLLGTCAAEGMVPSDLVAGEAVELLAAERKRGRFPGTQVQQNKGQCRPPTTTH